MNNLVDASKSWASKRLAELAYSKTSRCRERESEPQAGLASSGEDAELLEEKKLSLPKKNNLALKSGREKANKGETKLIICLLLLEIDIALDTMGYCLPSRKCVA